jgi:hypothetical protein
MAYELVLSTRHHIQTSQSIISIRLLNTIHTNTPPNIITHNLRRTIRTSQLNPLQQNPTTSSARTTSQVRNNSIIFSRRRAGEIDEFDIGNVDIGRVGSAGGRVDVEVALIEDDGGVGVFDVDVFVGNVGNIAVACCWSCPCSGEIVSIRPFHGDLFGKTYFSLAPFWPLSRVMFFR